MSNIKRIFSLSITILLFLGTHSWAQTIDQIQEYDSSTWEPASQYHLMEVNITGVVTVVAETFHESIFYIEDPTGGVMCYDVPPGPHALWDQIQINGIVVYSEGPTSEIRINVHNMTNQGSQPALVPVVLTTTQVMDDSENIGKLAQVTGTVVSVNGNEFYLDDGQTHMKVFISPNAGIDYSEVAVGDTYIFTGVISRRYSEVHLKPRYQTDLVEVEVSGTPYIRYEANDGFSANPLPVGTSKISIIGPDSELGPPHFGTFEDEYLVPSWQDWTTHDLTGAGDFADLWISLDELDPIISNWTNVVSFCDPSYNIGINWPYGPYNSIVNPIGGALGPSGYLHNEIWSPKLPWPEPQYYGARLEFDVYRHETLEDDEWPGMFYVWHVRSSNDGGDTYSEWRDDGFVYYGGPDWHTHVQDVSHLLLPDVTNIQVALGVKELGYEWDYVGIEGTPAPYFDNVKLTAYIPDGPIITGREIDMPQDSFSDNGELMRNCDPGSEVPFLRANHDNSDLPATVGPDEIVVSIVAGSPPMTVPPTMTCLLVKPASIAFDCRPLIPLVPFAIVGTKVPGTDHLWKFSLAGYTFYPGDVLHYYFEATDYFGASSTLPADLTLFDRPEPFMYPGSFSVRALPTLDEMGSQPPILFWNDFGTRGGEPAWGTALANLGKIRGVDFDVFYTKAPTSGIGTGLGSQATIQQIDKYNTMCYSAGDLWKFTLGYSDLATRGSVDIELLDQWMLAASFFSRSSQLFTTGANIARDMTNSGPVSGSFLMDRMGVDFIHYNARYGHPDFSLGHLGYTAVLDTDLGNPLDPLIPKWEVVGLYEHAYELDLIKALDGPNVKSCAWIEKGGDPTVYSAAVWRYGASYPMRAVHLPYDLMAASKFEIPTKAAGGAKIDELLGSVGGDILGAVLEAFHHPYNPGEATGVPQSLNFQMSLHPNPFNPTTKIQYVLPQKGHLKISVYNVRGECVRTLVDEIVDSGPGFVEWDGTDGRGAAAGSGLYLFLAKSDGITHVTKATLVK